MFKRGLTLALAAVTFFSSTCSFKNPESSEKMAKVNLEFNIVGSIPWALGAPSGQAGGRDSTVNKAATIDAIDEVRVVFHAIDLSFDEVSENYSENYEDIYHYLEHFEGDTLDFNEFWMKKDKGELDRVAPGSHRVERVVNLTISGSTASGEFELTTGLKACRLGLFDGGKLMYVGRSSGLNGTGFFQVETDQSHAISADLMQVATETEPTDPNSGTMIGNDGTVYQTIKIGDQWWMAENLKETQYRDGTSIANITDGEAWAYDVQGAWCAYANNTSHADTYGYLYNWFAVANTHQLAPSGWRLPSDQDWKELEMALGMSYSEVNAEGSRGTNQASQLAGSASLWTTGALESSPAFGTSGFDALPAGIRFDYLEVQEFEYLSEMTYFWTQSAIADNDSKYGIWIRGVHYDSLKVGRDYDDFQYMGLSVRLVMGEAPASSLVEIFIPQYDYVYTGETIPFHCTAIFADSTGQNVTTQAAWSVSPGIAGSIDANGLFTAHASNVGTEIITATYQGETAEVTVMVEGQTTPPAQETGTMTGNDGTVYPTIKIGNQWWMAENLRETEYRDGTAIPEVTDTTAWSGLTTGARCSYENNETNADTYGYLYNWFAVAPSIHQYIKQGKLDKDWSCETVEGFSIDVKGE